ncbi:tetratricopeptide repeat protein [Leptospira noumeaensis]|uniref:Tetratricopeptide repeat protein n=1 Tax=Leptospira noumeaensis TaxID=2484964 RepID=A0A4R9I9F0_9LEPT|nr:tetratricopeptide repeat protein [Leptospira noumeaensis]TGK82977.1 tetratricopeptide repeat protein [Leptospira noumeaensis]
MVRKLILIITFFLSFNHSLSAEDDFLSETFIQNHKNYRVYSFQNEASKKIKNVENLKRKKEYNQAILEIHSILKIYPLSEIYYLLGNIYMDLQNYQLAEKAYKLSLIDNFLTKPITLYNLACLYSLTKNEDAAFKILKEALLTGYPYLDYIKKDKDLEYLRNTKNWDSFQQKYIRIKNENNFIGTYNIDDTGKNQLFLCDNNVAIKASYYSSTIDGSCCNTDDYSKPKNNYSLGKWRKIDNQIVVIYYKSCGYRGTLPPNPNEGAAADCVNRRNCSLTQECKNTNFNEYINFDSVDLDSDPPIKGTKKHAVACDT